MISYIKFGIILTLASAINSERMKRPFEYGIYCNVDSFQNATSRGLGRYYCIPRSYCRTSTHRIPVIPFDLCNDYYNGIRDEDLTCCHTDDFTKRPQESWEKSLIFVPSFKSFLMCRHYSHLLCAADGSSYCDRTTLKLNVSTEFFPKISEPINRFPHTALIGYPADPWNRTFHWFCKGSIISETVILTTSNCGYDLYQGLDKFSSHVMVGEPIICEKDCKDWPYEQTIPILRWEFGYKKSDINFIVLKHNIKFNQKVRPACFLHQPFSPTSGWHTHYGKLETHIKTERSIWPVFHYPANDTFIAFKVKTSQHAVIHLSETGGPYKTGNYWEITLGKIENDTMRSEIRRSDMVYADIKISKILNKDQFLGFWIKLGDHGILSFGEENKTTATLALSDPSCCFNISVIGVSTPDSTGEWLFADREGLLALHGQEMDVLWDKKCASYHPKFETVDKYVNRTNDTAYIGEAEFCAGDEHKGVAPCDNDWGSTIQTMDRDNMPCMWQMFGMYSQDEKRNCSAVLSPGVFINFANHLAYLENLSYPIFLNDWNQLKVDRPSCLLPTTPQT